MIKNDFYKTAATSYGIETTAAFMSISELIDDMGNQYLMGYVNSDDISLVAPVEIINGGDTVTMSRVPGNFGWGYAQWGYTGSYAPGAMYYNDSGTFARNWGIDYDFSFLNAVEMARVNTDTKLIPYISVAAIQTDLIDGYKMTQFANVGLNTGVDSTTLDNFIENTYTIDGWKNMVENDLPIFSGNVTLNNARITVPLTLRPSDFEHDNGMKFALIPTDAGYTLHCRIMGLKTGNTKYYYDNTHTIQGNIVPFFQFPDTHETPAMIIPGTFLFSQINLHYENGGIYATQGNVSGYYNELFLQGAENSRIFGGFDFGTISVNDVDFTLVFSNNRSWWCFVGNYVMNLISKSSGSAVFRVNDLYTPREIYDYTRLWHKRTDTPSETYSAADTVTVFDVTDAPTFDTVSGTLSEIAARLRPWQLPGVDISANDFKPEDIPTPEPEDADSTGDDIRDTDFNVSVIGAGNNFVTLYAMSSDGVSDMGKQLWASLSDPTYWQTVGTVFSNDFSINPADMLKYFLSLRYFPFNLSDLPHLTSPGVFIGRATAPLSPSTGIPFPLRLRKSICQLDGGSLTIRRKFNDFRDFEPCTTVQIHVPFCGTVDVPASEVVGKTLYLTYKIDLQTGAMLGVIAVQSNTYYVIATVAGSCGASIPITANNNIEFLQRIATVAGSGISGGISGGIKGASVGGEVGAVAGAIVGGVGGGVGALAGLPPVTVHKQGNASGFANLGGVPCAYVTIQRQRYTIPENYGHTSGYACDVSETVGNLSGFAVCENVDTSGLSCNATERAEIKRLLESGIYI